MDSTDSWPPWEVLVLTGQHLDPKTLAIASCVSKSWHFSMSSDQLWKPFCTTHYPYSFSLLKFTDPSISYRRLYSLFYAAANRRLKTPDKPQLSLDNLIFTINLCINHKIDSPIINLAKSGSELEQGGVFRFDIEVNCENSWEAEAVREMRVSWNVVLKGWRAVFSMVECEGSGGEEWFSAELPSPACCLSECGSGIMGDLKLGFGGDGGLRIKKVSVGILSRVNWRYVSVEYGLRYLEHFLLY